MAILHDYRMSGVDETTFEIDSHIGTYGQIIIPVEKESDGSSHLYLSISVLEAQDLIEKLEDSIKEINNEVNVFLAKRVIKL